MSTFLNGRVFHKRPSRTTQLLRVQLSIVDSPQSGNNKAISALRGLPVDTRQNPTPPVSLTYQLLGSSPAGFLAEDRAKPLSSAEPSRGTTTMGSCSWVAIFFNSQRLPSYNICYISFVLTKDRTVAGSDTSLQPMSRFIQEIAPSKKSLHPRKRCSCYSRELEKPFLPQSIV